MGTNNNKKLALLDIEKDFSTWICNPDFVELLDQYIHSLLSVQNKINLTGSTKESDIILHIYESMEMLFLLPPQWKVSKITLLDIGSGGGFPAIPLALALPSWKIVMTDSIRKKTSFLEWMKQSLKLDNTTVFHGRVEDYSIAYPDNKFDVLTAKGVGQASYLFALAKPLLTASGFLVLWKNQEEIMSDLEKSSFYLIESRTTSAQKSLLSLSFEKRKA